jgi:hypothetical protein
VATAWACPGYLDRNRDVGGAGIDDEFGFDVVDAPAGDVVTCAVA